MADLVQGLPACWSRFCSFEKIFDKHDVINSAVFEKYLIRDMLINPSDICWSTSFSFREIFDKEHVDSFPWGHLD